MFMHPNHTQYHNGSFISLNETSDILILHDHHFGYTEYNREFKYVSGEGKGEKGRERREGRKGKGEKGRERREGRGG
jgi:hypothetical protein